MAPATERERRLEGRQWVYRMSQLQFAKRNNDSGRDKDKRGEIKNRSESLSSNRRDGGGANSNVEKNGYNGENGDNWSKNKSRNKSEDNDNDNDTENDNDNDEYIPPPFPQPPPETTIHVIQPPPETTTQVVQGPPVVVTATAAPETVTIDPTTVTINPTTVILVSTMKPVSSFASLSSFIPFQSLSSQPPRKGIDEPGSYPPDFYSSTTTTVTTTTSATALANTLPTDADNDMDSSPDYNYKHKEKMDDKNQTAEHILIGAGSIGIFILVCLICFFGWRFIRRRKNPRRRVGGKFIEKMYTKMPWLPGASNHRWQSLEDEKTRGMATLARSNTNLSAATTIQGSVIGYYGPDKQIVVMDKQALDVASTLGSTLPTMAPTTGGAMPAGAGLYQQTGTMNSAGYAYTSTDPNLTMRSRMADPFFNQSELSRQPSDAYDPEQRQVNRASELSSLSSGFGDGDITIPQPFIQPLPPSAPSLRQSNNLVGRFSWQSRGANSNRETVYTESSEDSPARFRTVNSWVNQQTGRIKRAQRRAENGDEIPPMPDLPGVQPGVPGVPLATGMPVEHQYTMMLDFEEPKRPEKQG